MELAATSSKLPPWRLFLVGDTATLRPVEGASEHRTQRADAAEHLEIITLGRLSVLSVRFPGLTLQLKLAPEQRAELEAWWGPATMKDMEVALKRGSAYVHIIATVYFISSLPVAGASLDPVGLGLGVSMFAIWVLARVRPRPQIFLLDLAWFVALAGSVTWDVVVHQKSYLWLLALVLIPLVLSSRLGQYRRFRHLPTTERAPSST